MVESDGPGRDGQAPEARDPLGSIEMTPDPSGIPVVSLRGELDISNAEEIGAELERLVGTGTSRLVVDMSALEFMDSSGIAMLLHAAAHVESVCVRNPSTVVRRIIEATGLEAILPLEG